MDWTMEYARWMDFGTPMSPEAQEAMRAEVWEEAQRYDAHLCTPDCFTYAERSDDPTIESHFAARGPHICESAHSEVA
jgi:hypothetical protein